MGRVPACTEAAHALIKSRVYPHVTSFTRPSSRLTNSFFPASKIVIAEESEREGGYMLNTLLVAKSLVIGLWLVTGML